MPQRGLTTCDNEDQSGQVQRKRRAGWNRCLWNKVPPKKSSVTAIIDQNHFQHANKNQCRAQRMSTSLALGDPGLKPLSTMSVPLGKQDPIHSIPYTPWTTSTAPPTHLPPFNPSPFSTSDPFFSIPTRSPPAVLLKEAGFFNGLLAPLDGAVDVTGAPQPTPWIARLCDWRSN